MSSHDFEIEYNSNLAPLEEVLAGVKRPGTFYASGTMEAPMPQLTVKGVGTISFPVPAAQAEAIIAQAQRAPYGRGGETILDTNVRRVWQLLPEQLTLGGKSWARTFAMLLERALEDMGCDPEAVAVELYKLLVYDEGAFFLSHRDTEKSAGMFGTLVVVLPSEHRGGELVIRHAGAEVTCDLCASDPAELAFAAFYADCEHEVKPVTQGHRVCLVYNLMQKAGADQPLLRAPDYATETERAAARLREVLTAKAAPAKLVWLLEHQYSPAGLSFAALKNGDAALGRVLTDAAALAECAVHLGIVHIEESGPAEIDYDPRGYRSRSYRRGYDDDDEEDADDDDFEIVEISDSNRYLNEWRAPDGSVPAYGDLPLADGELLPAGALDDEKPDEQRLMEATGNEGASFERSYHRAALVLWRHDRWVEVLLQSGVNAAQPFLAAKLDAGDAGASAIARRILYAWRTPAGHWRMASPAGDRAGMLRLLCRLDDKRLLVRFIRDEVVPDYDGKENDGLAEASALLSAEQAEPLFTALAERHVELLPTQCLALLRMVADKTGERFQGFADAALLVLPRAGRAKFDDFSRDWQRWQNRKPIAPTAVSDLLAALHRMKSPHLAERAVREIVSQPDTWPPDTVLVPALATLTQENTGEPSAFAVLWQHSAQFLLTRSGTPPAPPADWHQDVTFPATHDDSRALLTFARDPMANTHRLTAAQDRRSSIENLIKQQHLDMTCITETKGRPYTLIVTKTRGAWQRRVRQYRADLQCLQQLAAMPGDTSLLDEIAGALQSSASFRQ